MLAEFNNHWVNVDTKEQKEQLKTLSMLMMCFENQVKTELMAFLRYPSYIKTMEEKEPLMRLWYEGDNDTFDKKWVQMNDTRSFNHNGAIDAAGRVNQLCDDIHLPHLFKNQTRKEEGYRGMIGKEMTDLAILYNSVMLQIDKKDAGKIKDSEKMDINRWISMFTSKDVKTAERASDNAHLIDYYTDYPLHNVEPEELRKELKDFNALAIEHTGKPVFNENASSLRDEVFPVASHLLSIGFSRGRG